MGWEFRLFSRVSFLPASPILQRLFPEWTEAASNTFDIRTDVYYVPSILRGVTPGVAGSKLNRNRTSDETRLITSLHDFGVRYSPHGVKLRGGDELELKVLVEEKKRGVQKFNKKRCNTTSSIPLRIREAADREILDNPDYLVPEFDSQDSYTPVEVGKKVLKKEWIDGSVFVIEYSQLQIGQDLWHTVNVEVDTTAGGAKKPREIYRVVGMIFQLSSEEWNLSELQQSLKPLQSEVFLGGYPGWLAFLQAG